MNLDADHDRMLGMGARHLIETPSAQAYALPGQDRTYVLAARERLSLDDLRVAMTVVYDEAGQAGPKRLLFWETKASKGFDRDVLDFYKEERFESAPQPEEVAVVTESRVVRMVVKTTGIGFRLFTGRTLRVYPSIEAAVEGRDVE